MKPIYLKIQAFGSYGKPVEIDFTKSLENLFLITGDTGAGKTTIFDAIVFALYGEASANQDKKEGIMLQSQFASYDVKPMVCFTFADTASEKANIYTITRVPKHLRRAKRKGKNGREYIEENGSIELRMPDGSYYTERDVQDYVEAIIGLTKPQFMQVAMIAQGEFMELLRADTKSKVPIFRKLFHTDIYCDITEELRRRKDKKGAEMAQLKTECLTELKHSRCPEDYAKYQEFCDCEKSLNVSLARLDEYLILLEELCREKEKQSAKYKEEWEAARKLQDISVKEYNHAEALERAFQQREEALCKLSQYQGQKSLMEQQKLLVKRLAMAYEVQPYYEAFVKAQRDFQDVGERQREQQKKVPVLYREWEQSTVEYGKIEPAYRKEQEQYAAVKEQYHAAMTVFAEQKKILDLITIQEQEYKDWKSRYDQSKEELNTIDEKYKQAETEKEHYKDARLQVELNQKEQEKLKQLEEQFWDLQSEWEKCGQYQENLDKLRDDYCLIIEEYHQQQQQYQNLYQTFLNEQAGVLARQLENGKPCPVCGSLEHPAKKVSCLLEKEQIPTQEEVEHASQIFEEVKKRREETAAQIKSLSALQKEKVKQFGIQSEKIYEAMMQQTCGDMGEEERIHTLEKALEARKEEVQRWAKEYEKQWQQFRKAERESGQLKEQRQKVEENLEKDYEKMLAAEKELSNSRARMQQQQQQTEFASEEDAGRRLNSAQQAFAAVEKQYQQCRKNMEEKKAVAEQAQILLEEYEKQYQKQQEQLESCRLKYQEEYANTDFTKEEELLELFQYSKEKQKQLKQEVEIYEREYLDAKARKQAAEETIQGQEQSDLEQLGEQVKRHEEKVLSLEEKWKTAADLSKDNRKVFDSLMDKMQQRREVYQEQRRLERLYQVASGQVSGQHKMDLETYVQRYYLRQVLVAANRRFEKMTAGQFRLMLKDMKEAGNARNEGLDLMVYSLITGKEREIRTLSGGESFMAALSLALGMADEIQAGSGSIHLDMMFIDEGFGSLDEHSRNQAIRILKELAGGDRMIGIISHVTELKNAIDNQLVVTKSSEGSSVRWIS